MDKEVMIVLALLIGAVSSVFCSFNYAHTAEWPEANLDLLRMVSYSCSGGSTAEQSFYFSLQKEEEKIRFSCEYFVNEHDSGQWEKYVVEDAPLPLEYFTELMRLMANVKLLDKQQADEIIVLDAATYSLTIYFNSGQTRRLDSHLGIRQIEDFFRAIKVKSDKT